MSQEEPDKNALKAKFIFLWVHDWTESEFK